MIKFLEDLKNNEQATFYRPEILLGMEFPGLNDQQLTEVVQEWKKMDPSEIEKILEQTQYLY